MAKAYVVVEIRVSNRDGYAGYLPLSTASIAQYGGRWLVRGGEREQVEGEDDHHNAGLRTVIVEFDSMEQARRWYASPEYQQALKIRQANATSRMFFVEGVAG